MTYPDRKLHALLSVQFAVGPIFLDTPTTISPAKPSNSTAKKSQSKLSRSAVNYVMNKTSNGPATQPNPTTQNLDTTRIHPTLPAIATTTTGYRRLTAAILTRAIRDLENPKHQYEAKRFLQSTGAAALAVEININPSLIQNI